MPRAARYLMRMALALWLLTLLVLCLAFGDDDWMVP